MQFGLKNESWGWYVVLASFLIIGVNYGARYSFGIFLKPMAISYGWSRSVVSIGSTINMLCYGISVIYIGRLVDKFAPKWIITVGSVLVACGLFLATIADTPMLFYLAYGFLCGIGSSGMSMVVCNSSVGKWFQKNRGLAIGITTMGISFGSLGLAAVSAVAISAYDWRVGYCFIGFMILLIGISFSQMFMGRKSPVTYEYLQKKRNISVPGNYCSTKEKSFAGNKSFVILAICYSLVMLSQMASFTHQVPYATDMGIDEIDAAFSIGILGISSSMGQFCFGWLCDRISDSKYSAFIGFIIMAIGTLILIRVSNAFDMYLYAAVYGLGYGSFAPMLGILSAEYFGVGNLGKVYGLLTFFVCVGGSLGPIIGGAIYDMSGTYIYLWYLNIFILAFVSLLILGLKKRELYRQAVIELES